MNVERDSFEGIEVRIDWCETTLKVIDDYLNVVYKDDKDKDLLSDVSRWLEDVERACDYLYRYMVTQVRDMSCRKTEAKNNI